MRRLPILFAVALLGLNAASKAGEIFAPSLIHTRPLLLLLLNANDLHLTLTATSIPVIPYYLVGGLRRCLEDPVYFLLGVSYGETAVEWAKASLPDASNTFAKYEKWISRAAPLVLLVYPNCALCVLEGAAGMPPSHFALITILGVAMRMMIIRSIGGALSSYVHKFLSLVKDYQYVLMIPSTSFALAGVLPMFFTAVQRLMHDRQTRAAENSGASSSSTSTSTSSTASTATSTPTTMLSSDQQYADFASNQNK